MCGILFANYSMDNEKAQRALSTLKARGPDHQELLYVNGMTFGHSRLSIIDIDKRSNQPMVLDKCIICFNGEIYNYKTIKTTLLKSYDFKTASDTEVIIALYKKFGIDGFKYLEGMFAFVLYDKHLDKVLFVRDPVGIKPLYYYMDDRRFVVASKISTILEVVGKLPLNYRGINDCLALGYPRTSIYQSIREFRPGYCHERNLESEKIPFIINPKKTFKEAIIEQFVNSDRPVGITLSGGVDSSYIALVCSRISKKPIHTFTVGFDKDSEDIRYARKLSKLIKSVHHEIIVSKLDYKINLREGIEILEGPFDLGSVGFTNLLAKEVAKTDIKVILIGEGADEVQGGYKRYNEKSGMRTAELWEWYQQRIIKNDFKDRKAILKENCYVVPMVDAHGADNSNKILWFDFENELRYYHLKRIDHIVSDYGIEARVPYLDYSIVMNTFILPFAKKVNQRGNKLLLRDAALKDGLPEEFAFRPKLPLKADGFDAKEQLIKLYEEFIEGR